MARAEAGLRQVSMNLNRERYVNVLLFSMGDGPTADLEKFRKVLDADSALSDISEVMLGDTEDNRINRFY